MEEQESNAADVGINLIDALREDPCILAVVAIALSAFAFAYFMINSNNKHMAKVLVAAGLQQTKTSNK